jgi:hypothetical protein
MRILPGNGKNPAHTSCKRLQLTPKGDMVLQTCYQQFRNIPGMLFWEMAREDVELCVQLLKNVDIKFSGLWQQHRTKPFDQVYKSLTGKRTDKNI